MELLIPGRKVAQAARGWLTDQGSPSFFFLFPEPCPCCSTWSQSWELRTKLWDQHYFLGLCKADSLSFKGTLGLQMGKGAQVGGTGYYNTNDQLGSLQGTEELWGEAFQLAPDLIFRAACPLIQEKGICCCQRLHLAQGSQKAVRNSWLYWDHMPAERLTEPALENVPRVPSRDSEGIAQVIDGAEKGWLWRRQPYKQLSHAGVPVHLVRDQRWGQTSILGALGTQTLSWGQPNTTNGDGRHYLDFQEQDGSRADRHRGGRTPHSLSRPRSVTS